MFKAHDGFLRFAILIVAASLLPLAAASQETVEAESSGLAGLVGTWKLSGESRYGVSFEGSFDGEGLSGDILTGGASFAAVAAPRQARK